MSKRFWVGTQSWGYDDWVTKAGGKHIFYPRGTKRSEMLGLYSRVFDTIEVDATLYGVPPLSTFQNWFDETPEGFKFGLKFPREITHDRALRGPSLKLTREFVERASILGEKLGVFLVQFPASFEATAEDTQALRRFLTELTGEFRFAFEFRSPSWYTDATYDLLQAVGASLCLVDGKWIERELMFDAAGRFTTPFRYVRLMGERDIPIFDRIRRPRDEILSRWSDLLAQLPAEEVYIYADNYFEGFAPATANRLLSRLGLAERDPESLEAQGSLF
jgi:uncharacterized protein YecE (DUF72 family)